MTLTELQAKKRAEKKSIFLDYTCHQVAKLVARVS